MERYQLAAATGRLPALDDEDPYYREVLGSGQSDEEEGGEDQPEFTALRRSKGSDPLVAASPTEIAALVAWGRRYEHQPDSRLGALLTFLDAVCRPDGATWTNERVVVFFRVRRHARVGRADPRAARLRRPARHYPGRHGPRAA